MKDISGITRRGIVFSILLWVFFLGAFLVVPQRSRAKAPLPKSVDEITRKSDSTCAWIADSKITCGDFRFYFDITHSQSAGKPMYIASNDLDNSGKTENFWIAIDPKTDASSGYVTANSDGGGTNNKSVHINANHKLIENRMFVADSAPQAEPQYTDSWKGKTQETGEYKDDEAEADEGDPPFYYICGLLSRYKSDKGENCYVGRKGIKFQMTEEKSKLYSSWTKDIRTNIQSADECDSNTLSFILCPLLDGMQSAVYYLIGQPGGGSNAGLLGNLLTVKPLSTEDKINVPDKDGATKSVDNYTLQAWSRIRDISLGFMILIFVIIIFGNGLGIDAYTVKRAIPRLAIGSLMTFASFYLLQTLIDLSNVLGRAVPSLLSIASPAGTSTNGFNFNLDFGVTGGLVAIILMLILYFLALLAILVGIAGLIVRQLVIYALVLTAPIAFVAWVLPNTEKLFKKWWSNLIKVLMMYPIVTGMLAIAILFQNIVGSDSSQPFSVRLIGAVAPLLALMAIPKTFKMGGDLFTAGAGFVAGRVSKGTDAVKGKAAGVAKGAAKSVPNRFMASDRGQKIALGAASIPIARSLGGKQMQKKFATTRATRMGEAEKLVENMSGSQLEMVVKTGNYQQKIAAIGQLAKNGERERLHKLSSATGSVGAAYTAASGKYGGDFGKHADLRRTGGEYTNMASLSDDQLAQLNPHALQQNIINGRITSAQVASLQNNTRAMNIMSVEARNAVNAHVAAGGGAAGQAAVQTVYGKPAAEHTTPTYQAYTKKDGTVVNRGSASEEKGTF